MVDSSIPISNCSYYKGLARGGGEVLPYIGYAGMCGLKGYGIGSINHRNWSSIGSRLTGSLSGQRRLKGYFSVGSQNLQNSL